MIAINSTQISTTFPQAFTQPFVKLNSVCTKVSEQLHDLLKAAGQGELGEVFKFHGEKFATEFDGIVEETRLCWRELFRMVRDDSNSYVQRSIEGFEERAWRMLELAKTIPTATVGLSYLKEYVARCDTVITASLNLQSMFMNQWRQRGISYETTYDLWLRTNESFPKDLVCLAKWKTTKNAKKMKRFIKELGETGNESLDEDEIDRILPSRMVDRGALVASAMDACEMSEVSEPSSIRKRRFVFFKEHAVTKHSAAMLKLCHKLLRKIKQKCIPNSTPGSTSVVWLDNLLLTSDKLAKTADALLVHLCKNPNPPTSAGIALSLGRAVINLAEHARLKAGDNPYHPHQRWFDDWQEEAEAVIEQLLDFAPLR